MPKAEEQCKPEKMVNEISFKDFQKLDLRIGKVETAERVKGSDNLLRLIVDFGDQKLQAVSGLARWYKPEDMIDKEYMFILNLERKKFMGVESQCMIFCAEEEDGTPIVLVPEREVKAGSRVH